MGAVLGLSGILGFLFCLVLTIVMLVRKKPAKKSTIGIAVSLAVIVVGFAITPEPEPKTEPVQVPNSSVQSSLASSVEESSSEAILQASSLQEEKVVEKPIIPKETVGQKNALSAAKNYISVMPLSYSGLIAQLEFEKYSTEDATYGADNCGADWNKQAEKAAKNYLSLMSFSRDGLIEQLEFDGFTNEQAVYGVEKNGY